MTLSTNCPSGYYYWTMATTTAPIFGFHSVPISYLAKTVVGCFLRYVYYVYCSPAGLVLSIVIIIVFFLIQIRFFVLSMKIDLSGLKIKLRTVPAQSAVWAGSVIMPIAVAVCGLLSFQQFADNASHQSTNERESLTN